MGTASLQSTGRESKEARTENVKEFTYLGVLIKESIKSATVVHLARYGKSRKEILEVISD